MGRDPPAAVYNGADRRRHLHGRNLKGLAERHGCQLYQPNIFQLMHDNIGFAGQIDTGLLHEPELPEIPAEILSSHPLTNVNECRIAGILDGLYKGLASMPLHLMAADPPDPPPYESPDS